MVANSTSYGLSRQRQLQGIQQLSILLGINDPWVRKSLASLQLHWNDRLFLGIANRVAAIAELAEPIQLAFSMPENPSQLAGELRLGHIIGRPEIEINWQLDRMPLNILASGIVGSGKTNFANILAEAAMTAGVDSVSIVDPKADEYISLAQKLPGIIYLKWSELRFNVLSPPPRVPWIEWVQLIAMHMANCFNFWEGAAAMLLDSIEKSKSQSRVITLGKILSDLLAHKKTSGQKDAMSRSTLVSRLRMMCQLFGTVISSDSEMLEWLVRNSYILSTSGLMDQSDTWLSEYMFLWEFMYRVYNPDRRILALRVFDECQHRLFSSHKEHMSHQTGAPLISRLVDESRALRLGVCALSQEPSSLIKALLNNSGLKVCFHLGSGGEIKTMKEAMGLDDEQARMLHYLEPGQAILRMTTGFKEPLAVEIGLFDSSPSMNDLEFREHQQEMKEVLFKEVMPKSNGFGLALVRSSRGVATDTTGELAVSSSTEGSGNQISRSATTLSQKVEVPDAALRLIRVWLNRKHPFLTQGQILRLAGIESGSVQAKMKKSALSFGLIKEHRLQVKKGRSSVWEPTHKAWILAGIQKPHLRSKGGYLHQFLAHHLMNWASALGYTVDVEFQLSNGKAVDLVLRNTCELVFVEIAISPPMQKEIGNIIKDFETDLIPDKLVLLATDSKARAKLETLVESDSRLDKLRSRIEIALAGDYLLP